MMRSTHLLALLFILGCAGGCSRTADTARTPASPDRHPLVQRALSDEVIDAQAADLDGDGVPETVAITCRTRDKGHPLGGEIVVLQPDGTGLRVIWRQRRLNPWKLQIADVDGDGQREIVAGVWKKSPMDQVMARRVFVYSWNGARMLPKWLGSRLSRRFDDFVMCDVNGDNWDELIALEGTSNSTHRISVYRWRSFGFDWLGCSDQRKGLTALEVRQQKVFAVGSGRKLHAAYADGAVVLK